VSLKFKDELFNTKSPFLDIMMKNIKIIIGNSIVKNEYAATMAETKESLQNAEIYKACVDNNVSLGLFSYIPEELMYSVGIPPKIIKLYKNFGNNLEFIPKDDGNTNYRQILVNNLRPWFINNYEEKNEYYRMICGYPPLDINNEESFGIPVRDYEYLLPDGFNYIGEYIHELSLETIKEIDMYGVIDQAKRTILKLNI
jgi:hypothetical protein